MSALASVRRLDPVLIDRIAAGEVVERPAAAVKELVENALDAGARHIAVTLEEGGIRLIRVEDDGIGMGAADLDLAVERHATSKLPDGDLSAIATLGFRGEALPSIGAVARLLIRSRARGAETGCEILVDGGAKGPVRPAAQVAGTTIEVRDLFFATPARLKFLKTPRAEAQAVAGIIRRLAIAHPGVRFSLRGDHLSGFDFAARAGEGAALARLADVLGAEFRANAVAIDAARDGVALTGFAALPTFHRASAQEQYLFVNGRPVRDKVLVGALRAAYADVLARDRHPMAALFVTLDPRAVDVNVHPAKAEVRFADPGLVRGLIIGGLRQALAAAGHRASSTGGSATIAAFRAPPPRPPFGAGTAYASLPGRGGAAAAISPFAPDLDASPQPAPGFDPALRGFHASAQAAFGGLGAAADLSAAREAPTPEVLARPLGVARAHLLGTYILAQTADAVILVDAHAAHERLVYEKLKAARAGAGVPRQLLLIPAIVEGEEARIARLIEAAPMLEAAGFAIEPFGPGAIAVREMPAALIGADVPALLADLADHLEEVMGIETLEARIDLVLKTFACHHSVRAGRTLKPEEMDALLREMEATPGSGQCNHGRPTYVELKAGDLARLFGR